LRSLSPNCLRRLLSRSDCCWWGVSTLCCRRRLRELSGFFGVGVYRSFLSEVLAHPPTWLIGFPIIQRGRCSVELYSVVVSEGKFQRKRQSCRRVGSSAMMDIIFPSISLISWATVKCSWFLKIFKIFFLQIENAGQLCAVRQGVVIILAQFHS